MKRRTLLLTLLAIMMPVIAVAQRYTITGTVIDGQERNAVSFAAAALLGSDKKVITGTTTDEKGNFTLRAKAPGKYTLRLSSIGYKTLTRDITVVKGKESIKMDSISIEPNSYSLGTAVVSATASKVEQKEDTTVFNATAYRVPQGSTLEALVKQLPGVEISDEGAITWNGKEVKEFLVNGKDFFKGDTKIAMQNLPADLVSQLKAYDKKSDYAEQTGIDDGEETTVLDISTKRELNASWVGNLDLGYGTEDRYTGNYFITRFTGRSRISSFGAMNNVADRGFGSSRGWRGNSGLTASKQAGIDFSWENDKEKRAAGRLELGGNIRYNHTSNDLLSTTSSETFLTTGRNSSFSNSRSFSGSHSTNVNSSLRVEWHPDTMTSVTFRPSFSHSGGHNSGNSLSGTFNDDPFDIPGMYSPLDSIFAEEINPSLYAIAVNRNNRLSLGSNNNNSVNGSLSLTRRLNSNGRNVSLRANGGFSEGRTKSYSISDIKYFTAGKSDNFLNQFSHTPSKNCNYSLGLGYVEPIVKNWFAEVRYKFSYKYTDSDRSRYNLDSLGRYFPEYADFGNPTNYPEIGTLPDVMAALDSVRDDFNSQYATYKYYNHTANVGVRYNSEAIRFNADVSFNPEKTKMAYERPGQNIDTLITRSVFNISPSVRFRYRFSKTDNLDIDYRGYSSQPSMTNLLAVIDNSNPLNISMGNPGLKPSWNNTMRILFRGYNVNRQQGIMGGFDMTQTNNSVSNRVVYDETTGVRYSRPENINGNWNANAMFMFNTGLGAEKLFNISTFTRMGYNNSVGYISTMNDEKGRNSMVADAGIDGTYEGYDRLFTQIPGSKNTTRTLSFNENLRFSYRTDLFDVSAFGRVRYQHARATLQENANMDTWNFSYGAEGNLNLDFGLSISTDIRMNSRRGYADASMNTNELIWNAQIAQSFLKKRATISLQFYDILREQSNVSRTINATMRSDSWNNAINAYCMIHFIYKLNIFPGSKSGSGEKGGSGRGGHMPMMRMGGERHF